MECGEINSKKRAFINKFNEEKNKQGIKILMNVENLKLPNISPYVPKPADKAKKFEIKKKDKFIMILRIYRRINTISELNPNSHLIKLHNNHFGVLYFNYYDKCSFMDVYNHLGIALYRITKINSAQFRNIITLKDGTYLIRGHIKDYVIYIIEDKGYQILYEINIPPIYLQTHDEKLVTKREEIKEGKNNQEIVTCYLGLFEKNKKGIYQRKKEIKSHFFEKFEQIKDNLMVTKDKENIYFYQIDTLEVVNKINYICPNYNYHFALLNEKYLLIASNFTHKNLFALVDMQNSTIIEIKTEEELKYEEYCRNNDSGKNSQLIPIVINTVDYFPDRHLLINFSYINHKPNICYKCFRWDNEKKMLITYDFFVSTQSNTVYEFIYLDDSDVLITKTRDQFIYIAD